MVAKYQFSAVLVLKRFYRTRLARAHIVLGLNVKFGALKETQHKNYVQFAL